MVGMYTYTKIVGTVSQFMVRIVDPLMSSIKRATVASSSCAYYRFARYRTAVSAPVLLYYYIFIADGPYRPQYPADLHRRDAITRTPCAS